MHNEEFPAITELSKQEKRIVNDTCVKFHVFSNILDFLAINSFIYDKASVDFGKIMKWLNRNSTYSYNNSWCAKIDLWIHEMIWLDLVSYDEETKEMSLTKNGMKVYQKQEFHIAYANLLQAKASRNLARAAFWCCVFSLIVSLINIFA